MLRNIITLGIIIVTFGAGYGFALFKQSQIDKQDIVEQGQNNHTALLEDCEPKPTLSFKKLTGKTSSSPAPAYKIPVNSQNEDQEEDEPEEPSSRELTKVTSLQSLKAYLRDLNIDNFDSSLAIDFLDSSEEGMLMLLSSYKNENDSDKKSLLFELLSETTRPEKQAFAEELLSSSDPEERIVAYSWLSNTEDNVGAKISLIDASYYEQDTDALSELVSAMSAISEESTAHTLAVNRLNELAFHPDSVIATQSISVVSGLTQDASTLSMLNTHLDGSSEEHQIAALNGLYYFDGSDPETYDRLSRIADGNSDHTEDVRELSRELIQLWDQHPGDGDEEYSGQRQPNGGSFE